MAEISVTLQGVNIYAFGFLSVARANYYRIESIKVRVVPMPKHRNSCSWGTKEGIFGQRAIPVLFECSEFLRIASLGKSPIGQKS